MGKSRYARIALAGVACVSATGASWAGQTQRTVTVVRKSAGPDRRLIAVAPGTAPNVVGTVLDSHGGRVAVTYGNAAVTAAVSDGRGGWFLGGDFSEIDGRPARHLAHVLATGKIDLRWHAALGFGRGRRPRGASGPLALARTGNRLYIAGGFGSVDGVAREGLAAIAASSGRLDQHWHPSVTSNTGAFNAVVAIGRRLYVGVAQRLTSKAGDARFCVAALGALDGSLVRAFTARIVPLGDPACVNALTISKGTLYVGGNFDRVGRRREVGLAALDAKTGAAKLGWRLRGFRDGGCSCGDVEAVTVHGNDVYFGGGFTGLSGQRRTGAAAAGTSRGQGRPWSPSLGSTADGETGAALLVASTVRGVAIGGNFTSVNGVQRHGFAITDAVRGTPLPSWAPGQAESQVLALATDGAQVYVGGTLLG